jgi:glycosyltransferase involved in cell wall biosynthesis
MTLISIVIPIYNESSLVSELINRVKQNVEIVTLDYELILIDDGSIDQTWNLISADAQKNSNVKAMRFSRNFGHHYAITAGLKNASGDWVIVMDGDLQDRPENIPKLYKKALEGYDIVFVSRKNRPEKLYYRLLQKVFYWILNILSGIKFDSSQANFSIINKKVVEAFKSFPENARFYGSTITWLGFKRTSIFADHGKRFSGKSSYTLKKRIKLASDIIIAFSDRPLKFAIFVGILFSSSSIVFALFILIRSLNFGFSVLGWPSLIVSIYFLSGVILTVLGILGVYLGRIFQEVKNRPLYVLSEKLNFEQSPCAPEEV